MPDPSGRAPFLLVPLLEADGAAGEGMAEVGGEEEEEAELEEAPPVAQRRRPLARETKSFGGGAR